MGNLFFSLVFFAPSWWDNQLTELRQSLLDNDLYRSKQLLYRLKQTDPERYDSELLMVTSAWIAKREGRTQEHVDNLIRALDLSEDPNLVLELAEGLFKLRQFPEVLAALKTLPRDQYRGKHQHQYRYLLARSQWETGQGDAAYKNLQKLASLRMKSSLKQEILLELVEWSFALGKRSSAHHYGNQLCSRWPSSDEALSFLKMVEKLAPEYLDASKNQFRVAWVYYRNRRFIEARQQFERIIGQGIQHAEFHKALYFHCLTYLKEEEPKKAYEAFQRQWPHFRNSKFEGQAAFQIGRCLLMLHEDEKCLQFFDREKLSQKKWQFEAERIKILAMRRSGALEDFKRMGSNRISWPNWLHIWYDRNDCVWAIHRGEFEHAQQSLTRLSKQSLSYDDRLENKLWLGLLQYSKGEQVQAGETWLSLITYDPNHYHSLVALALLRNTGLDKKLWYVLQPNAGQLTLDTARKGYFICPDPFMQNQYALFLRSFLPEIGFEGTLEGIKSLQIANQWASIGRYDLAANWLPPKINGLSRNQVYSLKAEWFQAALLPHSSIYYAEILAKKIPRWMPLELYPEKLQAWMYPEGFKEIVDGEAKRALVDPALVLAMIREESRFDPDAKSVASARGLMQFIPSTASDMAKIRGFESFETQHLYDPKISIALGATYLNQLLQRFEGKTLYSVAAYNAGELAVERWDSFQNNSFPITFLWDISYTETKKYCQKVLKSYMQYRRIYHSQSESGLFSDQIQPAGM